MFTWQPESNQFPITPTSSSGTAAERYWQELGASPDLAANMEKFAYRMKALGHETFFVQIWRSYAQQNSLYSQGRTTPGKRVTDARPMQSAHCAMIDGRPASQAFDIAPRIGDRIYWPMDETTQRFWSDARDSGKMLGLVWGATFNTPPRDFGHFQLSTFKKAAQ